MEKMPLSINCRFDAAQITDVIWLQTSFIGDIVLTTAAISRLKKLAPHIRQHLITTPVGSATLKGHPDLALIEIFEKRGGTLSPFVKTRSKFKSLPKKSTVLLQPHKSFRSTLLSLTLGFPVITYNETSFSSLAAATVPRVAIFHEADRISLLLEPLGFQRHEILGSLPTLPPADHVPQKFMLPRELRWVGIAPGSVWPTKRWPAEKFATLAQLLTDRPEVGVILLGSKEENGANQMIEDTCNRTRPAAKAKLRNFSGATSLQDLRAIYPQLSLVISNDSSPVHFASAFRVPTVAIFGATVSAMGFGPLAPLSTTIESQLDCRPCSDHGPIKCPLTHFNCMNQLSVNQVLDASLSILSKSST
jgi:heptosyltransferase-2